MTYLDRLLGRDKPEAQVNVRDLPGLVKETMVATPQGTAMKEVVSPGPAWAIGISPLPTPMERHVPVDVKRNPSRVESAIALMNPFGWGGKSKGSVWGRREAAIRNRCNRELDRLQALEARAGKTTTLKLERQELKAQRAQEKREGARQSAEDRRLFKIGQRKTKAEDKKRATEDARRDRAERAEAATCERKDRARAAWESKHNKPHSESKAGKLAAMSNDDIIRGIRAKDESILGMVSAKRNPARVGLALQLLGIRGPGRGQVAGRRHSGVPPAGARSNPSAAEESETFHGTPRETLRAHGEDHVVLGTLDALTYRPPRGSQRGASQWIHESGDRGILQPKAGAKPKLIADAKTGRPEIWMGRSPMRFEPDRGLVA